VLCCFSLSSSKKRKRKLSQPHNNTHNTHLDNACNAFTTLKHNDSTRNTQLLSALPKEDLFHKFNSVSSANELSCNSNVYIKQCQQTLSSLMDNDGNELTNSNVNVDNRLDISLYVISTNKMPAQPQHKQRSSFHRSQKSLFSNTSSTFSCFKSTAEMSNQSVEGNKARLSSCDNRIRSSNKALGEKIEKKVKEINGIKDKINEITNMVRQYEDETQNIITTIEKEEKDAQVFIYMLNFLLNKQH
jgi:hypothetical protein